MVLFFMVFLCCRATRVASDLFVPDTSEIDEIEIENQKTKETRPLFPDAVRESGLASDPQYPIIFRKNCPFFPSPCAGNKGTQQLYMKIFRLIVASLVVAFVTSCSTVDTATETTPEIRPGMSKQQVRELWGEPQMHRSGAPGFMQVLGGGQADTIWTYHNGALNVIPFVGLARGGRTDSTHVFFQNGKVTQISQDSTGLW
jgi:hypothetical protein